MARTTADLVKALMAPGGDYDLVSSPDLSPFIDTASAIVDDVAECAINKDKALTTARLELIERWLAAHFYQQSDQGYIERATLRASGKFQGQTGMYLESTKYGQTARNLDSSGCLDAIATGTRKTAGGFWAGKPKNEQVDYEDRN